MTALRTFLFLSATLLVSASCWPQRAAGASTIEDFVRCLSQFESRYLNSGAEQMLSEEEQLIGAQKAPNISATFGPQKDFQNNDTPVQNTFNINVTQNIYSRSLSLTTEAYKKKALEKNMESNIHRKNVLQEKMEVLFEYVSNLENLKITERQIELQKSLFQLVGELVKAKIQDSASLFLVESDLQQYVNRKNQQLVAVANLQRKLEEYPFFASQDFVDEKRRVAFFDFLGRIGPQDPALIDDILILDLKASSQSAFLAAEKSQWFPRLDLSIDYTNSQAGTFSANSESQFFGQLMLTIPISDAYTHSARRMYYFSEQQMNLRQKLRSLGQAQTEIQNDKQSVSEFLESLQGDQNSLKLLLSAREVLARKFHVSKLNYYELNAIDQKIDGISQSIAAKGIALWRIKMKWMLQSAASRSKGTIQCL